MRNEWENDCAEALAKTTVLAHSPHAPAHSARLAVTGSHRSISSVRVTVRLKATMPSVRVSATPKGGTLARSAHSREVCHG